MSVVYRTLPPGACIGVVAPAGPADPAHLAQVEPLLAAQGWRTRLMPGCHLSQGYLAGTDARRLQDLHDAYADPGIDALVCLRGGYGAMRLLDRLDAQHIARHPKLLVGYSDITALQAWLDRLGRPSLHAPMLASDLVRPGRQDDARALFSQLRSGLRAGEVLAPPLDPSGLCTGGRAQGRLVGGNLRLVAALAGTPWAWRLQDAVLFIEDVDEPPYRVDRDLCQLRLCGALEALAGVVVGSFTGADSPREVLAHYLEPLGKPVLGGWPAGHGTPHLPLPMGVRVELDAGRGTLTLLDDLIVPA